MRDEQGVLCSESFNESFNRKNLLSLCLVHGTFSPTIWQLLDMTVSAS